MISKYIGGVALENGMIDTETQNGEVLVTMGAQFYLRLTPKQARKFARHLLEGADEVENSDQLTHPWGPC